MSVVMSNVKAIFFVSTLFLLGCREVRYHEFEPVNLDVLAGNLEIRVAGEFGENYETDGKKYLDWGFPYYLQFIYEVPEGIELSSLEIRDIVLTGEESGARNILPDTGSSSVSDSNAGQSIRVSVGPLSADDFSYQNYLLTAGIVVDTNGEHVESELSAVLETRLRVERRNDSFNPVDGGSNAERFEN